MLSAILNVFILNYLTTHVVCHLEYVYSKVPCEAVSIVTRINMFHLVNVFNVNFFLSQSEWGIIRVVH